VADLKTLIYMARDFARILVGRDYFHQAQGLGGYFQDGRSYYNDFKRKVVWTGAWQDGIPTLYVPTWQRHIVFPIMALQFGLGSLDTYLLGQDRACLRNVRQVTRWILGAINSQGCFNNYFSAFDPAHQYYSDNSSMAQGEALSFLIRVEREQLVEVSLLPQVSAAIRKIFENMVRPVEEGGTMLRKGEELFFCEVCRKDSYVILNGWIYSIFGLWDYCDWCRDSDASWALNNTLSSLQRHVASYIRSDGWNLYDNRGRICSPFYQSVHVSLFDALRRLTGDDTFGRVFETSARAYTAVNRTRFTFHKIAEKLSDQLAYSTA
jgi:hypothetical protein